MNTLFRNAAVAMSLLLLLCTPEPAGAAAPPRYTVTDLGTLPGESSSEATALNDRAQVIGICSTGGQGRAFLWEKGKMRPLPALPGFDPLSLWPHAINNKGTVVGTDFGPNMDTRRAFIYEHGVTRDLGTPAGEYTEATGINDKGQVIGRSYTIVLKNKVYYTGEVAYAFLWDPAAGFRKLNPAGNDSGEGVSAINNAGQIVGASMRVGIEEARAKRAALPPDQRPYEGNIVPHAAFFWQNGKTQGIAPSQSWSSGGTAINEHGDALGVMSLYPDTNEVFTTAGDSAKIEEALRHSHHVFLWREGQTQDLGEMGHLAAVTGFNNDREIVGYVMLDDASGYRAFLWRTGKQYMLTGLIPPTSGWVLDEAIAINNHGQIAGIGNHNGKRHAFLLTPR